jgi:hypothetical protein
LDHPFLKNNMQQEKSQGLKTNWPMVSACHAGRLADHRMPVGYVDL